MVKTRLAFASVVAVLAGCAEVAGTSAFRECEGVECDGAGGAGGGDASSTGASGTTTSSSTSTGGTTCSDVTVNLVGDVRVDVPATGASYEAGAPGPHCLGPGVVTLVATCHASGGDDPPVAVSWGDPARCTDGTTSCDLLVDGPITLDVSSTACVDD